MVRTQEASVLYVRTKFEWDSYKFISYKGPKISKLGHVTLSHAPFEHETLNLCTNSYKHTYCQFFCF